MTEVTNTPPKPAKKKETTGEVIRSFVFMVFLALIFRSVAYEPFHIPSGSMLSTLYEGDYIFVSKFSYGYSRFSFPFSPNLFDGRVLETMPKRGDVVVFRPPLDETTDFIKRIIGLPGDTIQMKNGQLFLNGKALEAERDKDIISVSDGHLTINASPLIVTDKDWIHVKNNVLSINGEPVLGGTNGPAIEMVDNVVRINQVPAKITVLEDDPLKNEYPAGNLTSERRANKQYLFVRRFKETLPEGRVHTILDDERDGPADNTPLYTVPAGHYFMMGDNRDHSQDSRFEDPVGYVPFENIVGRADVIAFSLKGLSGRWFKAIE